MVSNNTAPKPIPLVGVIYYMYIYTYRGCYFNARWCIFCGPHCASVLKSTKSRLELCGVCVNSSMAMNYFISCQYACLDCLTPEIDSKAPN